MRHAASAALLAVVSIGCAVPASAQAIRCSAFLHNHDGTWRSFQEADLFGPNGIVHVQSGEILRATSNSPKGEIARALNDLCESH